jgi:hypothetical protein
VTFKGGYQPKNVAEMTYTGVCFPDGVMTAAGIQSVCMGYQGRLNQHWAEGHQTIPVNLSKTP